MRTIEALILSALTIGTTAAHADDLDAWCSQAKKASSIVICSDPELREQALARNKLFEVAHQKLSPDEYRVLSADQTQWVKAYTANCGISLYDPLPTLPVSESVIQCYRQASHARSAVLQARLSEPSPAVPPASPGTLSPPPSVRSDVALELSHGIYVVPVLINGVLPLRFTVDSGAADVSIPADVFLTLVRTGTLSKEDYIGTQKYRLADGSITDSDQFYIRELKVGNQTIKNVAASIEGVKSIPLLGQTFLSKFASWSMDNERHTLALVPRGSDTSTEPNLSYNPPPSALMPPKSAVYQEGYAARRSMDRWFEGLSGDYRAGAVHWEGQRSLSPPGSCYSQLGQHPQIWTEGCLEAMRRFAPHDIRRKSEPEFSEGWNSY
jgi:predicted aspartyl protease